MPTIPKKIHFIWLGGPIPKNYLATIHHLAALAKNSGFEINLWVDNEKNYEKTALAEEMEIPNLRIRKIDEAFTKMREDKFHQEESQGKIYEELVRREMAGLKNLAAASDLLRYEILRQEGGVYFDTDTTFETRGDELKVEESEYGFKAPWRITSSEGNVLGGNDIIASIPDHPILKIAIKNIIKKYQIADATQNVLEASEIENEGKKPPAIGKYKESLIDKKRAQQSGCDLLVTSSAPTLENISVGSRNCYVLYQPVGQAPAELYYVSRNRSKKPVTLDKITHGFDKLIKSSLFSQFRGGQFQDIGQLTHAEARLIRDITGDERPRIQYTPKLSESPVSESRIDLTIDYSGPSLLTESFAEYCQASGIHSPDEEKKFFFNKPTWNVCNVLGTTATTHADQTWVEKKSASVSQRFFYDDSSIRYSDPHQATTQKKKY